MFSGCYQPAGPLIPMSPGWDPQKAGQPALQQLPLASPGLVQPVTCQTTITSASTSSSCHPSNNKLCEDGTPQAPASSRPAAESVLAKPQKVVSPGSVEVGVGTHSADKKSSRNRSFHSSVHSSDKLRNPVGNVPVGAAHLVVADQERELDLSQKGSVGYSSAGCGATVVTTHESIIKPAIGVVHDVSHATVATFSSGVSQIGHLERFVRGLVTSRSGSPVHQSGLPMHQPPQVTLDASNSPQTASSPHDSSKAVPKRKPEQEEVSIDERQAGSPKKTKYSVADEECVSEVQSSFKDDVKSSCTNTEDPEVIMDNQQSSSDASADAAAAVKQYADLDKSEGALSPDVVSTSEPPSEDQHMQQSLAEKVDCPIVFVESSESYELVGTDTSSNAEASCSSTMCEENCLPSPPKETPDTEQVGNPKSRDTLSINPKKGTAAGIAESKQRISPVRSKSATELNKKKTLVSVQEKRSEKVGTAQVEKVSRRSDEGSSRSSSARRKRDTGGWEWYGDPERKPVYFKVIC